MYCLIIVPHPEQRTERCNGLITASRGRPRTRNRLHGGGGGRAQCSRLKLVVTLNLPVELKFDAVFDRRDSNKGIGGEVKGCLIFGFDVCCRPSYLVFIMGSVLSQLPRVAEI